MDAVSSGAIVKIVASYGVLGLGWIAWLVTMFYIQLERKRYQSLVIHIIQHFTKINIAEHTPAPKTVAAEDNSLESTLGGRHNKTFRKLFGGD